MKWWVAGTAGVALILAGASIWLGTTMSELAIDAQILCFASRIIAMVAATWWAIRGPRNRAIMLGLLSLVSMQGLIFNFDILPKGPFCSRYLAEGDATCVQSTPLAMDIYLFAPIFILAITVLLSIFWPHRKNA